jgi:protease I
MPTTANGKKVAVLATDGVEQAELLEPVRALKEAGALVTVIALKGSKIQGFNHLDKDHSIPADTDLTTASPENFDALVLPGGVANPDALRMDKSAVSFVKHFVDRSKPIAAICHGPWTLIEAGGVRGHKMTSWPSLQTDLRNAGATWVDETVVVDGKLITSRKPDDLPKFSQALIEMLAA